MSQVQTQQLKRSVGLFALIIYGVGDILGAGIYALVGKVAGLAGHYVWLSFAIAMIVASLTGLTYAELGSRLPRAGGVAHFAHQAFKKTWLSVIVGWLMLSTSIVSMATGSKVFSEYLQTFFPQLPTWAIALVLFLSLAYVVYRGIKETTWLNIICTSIEATGLVIVFIVSLLFVFESDQNAQMTASSLIRDNTSGLQWSLFIQGASLAFYAFIGFEDLVNLAEEVKNPSRNIPLALLISLSIAGVVYIIISALAVLVIPPLELAESKAPLVTVVAKAMPSFPVIIFSVIALFAILNTVLLNFVTSTRLIYGMAEEKLLPSYFTKVHPVRKTPHRTIFAILPILFLLTIAGSLHFLAGGTATLILIVFMIANLSLIVIKRKSKNYRGFKIPKILPYLAFISNAVLIIFSTTASHLLALVVLGIGVILYVVRSKI